MHLTALVARLPINASSGTRLALFNRASQQRKTPEVGNGQN
jgi:hypothetical protein